MDVLRDLRILLIPAMTLAALVLLFLLSATWMTETAATQSGSDQAALQARDHLASPRVSALHGDDGFGDAYVDAVVRHGGIGLIPGLPLGLPGLSLPVHGDGAQHPLLSFPGAPGIPGRTPLLKVNPALQPKRDGILGIFSARGS